MKWMVSKWPSTTFAPSWWVNFMAAGPEKPGDAIVKFWGVELFVRSELRRGEFDPRYR